MRGVRGAFGATAVSPGHNVPRRAKGRILPRAARRLSCIPLLSII